MVDGYFIHQESPICSLPTTLSRHTQNTFPLPASRVFTTPPPTSKSSSYYLFLNLSFSYYSLLQEVFCVQCHNHQRDLRYVTPVSAQAFCHHLGTADCRCHCHSTYAPFRRPLIGSRTRALRLLPLLPFTLTLTHQEVRFSYSLPTYLIHQLNMQFNL